MASSCNVLIRAVYNFIPYEVGSTYVVQRLIVITDYPCKDCIPEGKGFAFQSETLRREQAFERRTEVYYLVVITLSSHAGAHPIQSPLELWTIGAPTNIANEAIQLAQ